MKYGLQAGFLRALQLIVSAESTDEEKEGDTVHCF